jgi:hypothetical protein
MLDTLNDAFDGLTPVSADAWQSAAACPFTLDGFSIRFRSRHKAKVGHTHRIDAKEAQEFLSKEFGVTII